MGVPREYHVSLIRSPDDLAALGRDWTSLYEAAPTGFPFSSYDWTQAWRSHLCPPSELFVLAVRSGTRLTGILPLRRENKSGFRVLRFLTDGRADYLGPLLAPGHDEAAQVLLESLCRYSAEWDLAILRNWSESVFGLSGLTLPTRVVSADSQSAQASYLSFAGSWNKLVASGPSGLRMAKRRLSKFERAGGSIERHTGADLVSCAQNIQGIEARSWKAGTRAAQFQTAQEYEMLEALLDSDSLQREIDVWIAWLDGLPVAYLLNFTRSDRTCYYQGAYDQNFAAYSPGTILHYRAIERTWHQGGRKI
jgi:CelD/BcsL family acetyltransferase involved in cellulose biosynthesis